MIYIIFILIYAKVDTWCFQVSQDYFFVFPFFPDFYDFANIIIYLLDLAAIPRVAE